MAHNYFSLSCGSNILRTFRRTRGLTCSISLSGGHADIVYWNLDKTLQCEDLERCVRSQRKKLSIALAIKISNNQEQPPGKLLRLLRRRRRYYSPDVEELVLSYVKQSVLDGISFLFFCCYRSQSTETRHRHTILFLWLLSMENSEFNKQNKMKQNFYSLQLQQPIHPQTGKMAEKPFCWDDPHFFLPDGEGTM